MAGYSGTPLPKKLGIKDGSRILLRNPPSGFAESLTPLPERARSDLSWVGYDRGTWRGAFPTEAA